MCKDCIAIRATIVDGNHNNTPLIDRVLLLVKEQLWELEKKIKWELERKIKCLMIQS